MAKIKIPIPGSIGKSINFDPDATVGATVGVDLKLADGTTPTLAELLAGGISAEEIGIFFFSQLADQIADSQVPESAVTQHEAALSIAASQITGAPVAFALTLDVINRSDFNAPNSERFFGNINSFIRKVDLSGTQQVRYMGRVNTASASANTPVIRLKYFTSFSTTVGDYLQLGDAGEVEFSVAATGYLDTGWLDLVAGAKVDNIFLAAVGDGGDAAADPAVSLQTVMFR